MVGTRQLHELMRHVRAAGGKLVLVGDPAQLPEINAGGLFAALSRTRQPLSLTGNQRQTADWERAALGMLRDGKIDTALAATWPATGSTSKPPRPGPGNGSRSTTSPTASTIRTRMP